MERLSRASSYLSPPISVLNVALWGKDLPVISTATSCYYSGLSRLSVVFWIPPLIFELVLCLLVVWKAWDEEILHRFGLGPHTSDGRPVFTTPYMVKLIARDR